MKIAFVFDGLGFGGIERVGIDYINICLGLGHDVYVYNLVPSYNALAGQIPNGVKYFSRKFTRRICPELYSYGVQKAWWGKYAYAVISPWVSLAMAIRKTFSKKREYDVAIAFSGHINDLSFVAKHFIKAKQKICWCHGNILSYFAICDVYPILYKKIDKFVVLSSVGQKDIYAGHKFMYEKKIYKIYNPTFIHAKTVNQQTVTQLKDMYGDFILYIGRFAKGKGQDVAIDVISELKKKNLERHIVFCGDGNTLETIKKYAEEKGVSNLCHFEGAQDNVADYISASYINLLTSKWEGLPTVIVEAMAMGKPCVMTNSDDGEVSGNGKFCKLLPVGDVDGISEAIANLYSDESEYARYVDLSKRRAGDFMPQCVEMQFRELIS